MFSIMADVFELWIKGGCFTRRGLTVEVPLIGLSLGTHLQLYSNIVRGHRARI